MLYIFLFCSFFFIFLFLCSKFIVYPIPSLCCATDRRVSLWEKFTEAEPRHTNVMTIKFRFVCNVQMWLNSNCIFDAEMRKRGSKRIEEGWKKKKNVTYALNSFMGGLVRVLLIIRTIEWRAQFSHAIAHFVFVFLYFCIYVFLYRWENTTVDLICWF